MIKPDDLRGAFYISGPSGSGKSTLARTLTEMGYNAIDVDATPELGHFVHIPTGERIEPEDIRIHDKQWSSHHRWTLNGPTLRTAVDDHAGTHVFICCAARNQYNYFSLFNKIFYLDASEEMIAERLKLEREHQYGKHSFQVEKILHDIGDFRHRMRAEDAIFIDAGQKPTAVAATVLEKAAA